MEKLRHAPNPAPCIYSSQHGNYDRRSEQMVVLGIGTDIVRTARFAEMLARNPHRLARLQQRILHPAEISENHPDRLRQLSSAWAAKEALFKSLSFADQRHCRFANWRKVKTNDGYKMVSNNKRNDEVHISLSHDGEYTIAFAVRSSKS